MHRYYGGAKKEAKALETYQTALVIVLIGCVVALFYLWLKHRQSTPEQSVESVPQEAPPQVPYSIPDPAHYVPEPEVQPQTPSDQHTIYAFEREVQVYVCPRCDGENSVHRNICCICGFEFRKGAWRL